VLDDGTDDTPTEIREVFTPHRDTLSADTLGLELAEAKHGRLLPRQPRSRLAA